MTRKVARKKRSLICATSAGEPLGSSSSAACAWSNWWQSSTPTATPICPKARPISPPVTLPIHFMPAAMSTYSTKRMPAPIVYRTRLSGLERLHEGKVRDIYAVDAETLLIVTTDRLSAFDVVLPDPIPDKGCVLNSISNFWFEKTQHLIPNHLTGRSLEGVVKDPAERVLLEGRAAIVRRLQALPIEAVVRGYLIGSGWK